MRVNTLLFTLYYVCKYTTIHSAPIDADDALRLRAYMYF